ncbi:MAG: type II toxin-antitoxin system Phd/YefM family antitoxin [Verrucomicrobiae bacterium]|nr:type II toxin-antitoxin system Phd/YefM family antitoxin [Verrucomicrobiae bacterium]
MTRTVSISDAKSHLSEFVGRMVYAGDHIIVERHGKPVVAMIPIEEYIEYQNLSKESKQGKPGEQPQEALPGLVATV